MLAGLRGYVCLKKEVREAVQVCTMDRSTEIRLSLSVDDNSRRGKKITEKKKKKRRSSEKFQAIGFPVRR